MLKVVVIDSGYGGEFFADRFEDEVNVVDIIRVIDWRHDKQYLTSPKTARNLASTALCLYIGKVDLIILANHLLSSTSLRYFRRKYPEQKFIGLKLKQPDCFAKKNILILTTKALTKTMEYHGFLFALKRHRVKTLVVDDWPSKIDEGELGFSDIEKTIMDFTNKKGVVPDEIILGCSQFEDIKPALKRLFGRKVKIHSSFDDAIREACKLLRIRGSIRKIKE
ncbi:hypothetical protein IJG22_01765 [Candidatus Saccharibacteria bacterium]|nr:hypothetical protein [Candidatus Saccharibacteria bacterium]